MNKRNSLVKFKLITYLTFKSFIVFTLWFQNNNNKKACIKLEVSIVFHFYQKMDGP